MALRKKQLERLHRFISERGFFISVGRHWKGIYIHFLPKYCYRLFYKNGFSIDRHIKARYIFG